ncbi:MAG: 2-hydroxychromene-2-carboxylate isomerase [Pseudomonadota bacterium]
MAETIDYFYSHISPYAYLGHNAFMEMSRRTGVEIRFRPVNLGAVFPDTGGVPLAKRHPARQIYRWFELQRWAEKRSVPMRFKPAHFPTDPVPSDTVAVALIEAGIDPDPFSRLMFAACWAEDRQIADESVISDALAKLGHDPEAFLAAAQSDAVRAAYAANAETAVATLAIGSPCYVRGGEPFWGQDRIDLLEDAIVSGRAPFGPL